MSALDALYSWACSSSEGTAHHAPKLRELASRVDVAVEFGVHTGVTSIALLAGGPKVYSYDFAVWPEHAERYKQIQTAVGRRWVLTFADTETVEIPECGLLFIDDLHEYWHVKLELELHAPKVGRYIAFHDTMSHRKYGMNAAANKPGQPTTGTDKAYKGILPAIQEFVAAGGWKIESHDKASAGLMVLERE